MCSPCCWSFTAGLGAHSCRRSQFRGHLPVGASAHQHISGRETDGPDGRPPPPPTSSSRGLLPSTSSRHLSRTHTYVHYRRALNCSSATRPLARSSLRQLQKSTWSHFSSSAAMSTNRKLRNCLWVFVEGNNGNWKKCLEVSAKRGPHENMKGVKLQESTRPCVRLGWGAFHMKACTKGACWVYWTQCTYCSCWMGGRGGGSWATCLAHMLHSLSAFGGSRPIQRLMLSSSGSQMGVQGPFWVREGPLGGTWVCFKHMLN